MIEFLVVTGILIGIYAILASGLNIQWGFSGLANFGAIGFFAIGAYAMAMGMAPPSMMGSEGTDTLLFALGLSWPFAALFAIVVCGIAAMLVGRILLRSDLHSTFVAVITLAFAEILLLILSTEKWIANGFNGVRGIERPLAGLVGGSYSDYEKYYLVVVLVTATLIISLVRYVQFSPYGRVLRGIREHPAAVEALGHNTRQFRLSAFVLGCLIMAIGGILWVPFVTVVEPSAFAIEQTFLIWAVLIIGGPGNWFGPALGSSIIIGLVQQGSRFIRLDIGPANLIPLLRGSLIGLLFIAFLLWRPQGLIPEQRTRRQIREIENNA